ncbi:endolytic transglycosylase MltG [Lachnospiraceae bacterium NSJ-143]|nr:endolytic transglycosylase MltG [Lachnospiraceae bacterium NSJ-143]
MENRRRRRRRRNYTGQIILSAAVLVIIGIIVFGSIKIYNIAFDKAKNYTSATSQIQSSEEPETVHIIIPKGASTKEIAEILDKSGLISNKLIFRLQSKAQGYDGTYMQGEYYIAEGTEPEEIMKIIQSGPVVDNSRKVTIPEGYTAKKIAALLNERGIVAYDEFIDEMNNGEFDYEFLRDIPRRDFYLEGYLFPATYEFAEGTTAHDIISKMLDRFEIAYDNILKNTGSEYTSDQIVTVASMVESEIQVDDERAIAAGVIYNRLKAGMKLQIDSTVQYANDVRNEVVTHDDLEVDSPYNTYMYEGLPVGPICNPGEAALEAAVNPDNNDYIYYVVKERGSGEHVFTDNYDDFLKAKENYKNSFNN